MQLGVLDRRRRPPRELLCKREVPRPEPAAGGRRDEGDRAENAASRYERHRHERSDAQLLDQAPVRFVPRDLANDLVRHLGDELRLATMSISTSSASAGTASWASRSNVDSYSRDEPRSSLARARNDTCA